MGLAIGFDDAGGDFDPAVVSFPFELISTHADGVGFDERFEKEFFKGRGWHFDEAGLVG